VTDLSVLCLQELWDVDQRNKVVSQLNGRYPYSLVAPGLAQNECNGGCGSSEISAIKDCINSFECLNIFDSTNFGDCVRANCRSTFEGLSAQCVTCLQQGDGLGDVFRNVDNCFSDEPNTANNGTCYAYNAQSDNVLLSKIPFDVTDVLYFSNSPITLTTALYGRMTVPNFGTVHAFCTHLLPADLPVFTFEEAVNLNQTRDFLAWVDSKLAGANDSVILLGDFNHGPGYWPANYDSLVQSGYVSAYIENGNRNCTFCASNPLSYGSETMIIDHVYLRNAQSTSSRRFATYWEENVDIGRDIIGIELPGSREVTLSDHYGVRAAVCPGSSGATGTLASQVTVLDNDTFPGSDDPNGAATICASAVLIALAALLM